MAPRCFEWKQDGKGRNPKTEIRKKSEGRSPKEAVQRCQFLAKKRMCLNETAEAGVGRSFAPLEDRAVLRNTRTEIAVHSGDTAESGPARISGFGLLSDFGFRPSDFPAPPFGSKQRRTK